MYKKESYKIVLIRRFRLYENFKLILILNSILYFITETFKGIGCHMIDMDNFINLKPWQNTQLDK